MQNITEEEKYWIWLTCVPDIAPKTFYYILKEFGSAESFFNIVADPSTLPDGLPERFVSSARAACSGQRVSEIIAELNSKDISVLTRLSPGYPQALTVTQYPPPVLFLRGSAAVFDSNSENKFISIVGTRRCTRKGFDLARFIAKELAEAGVTVVSGMARGIDTAAHMGALDAGGETIAVLGCGADVIYPPENEELYNKITGSGVIISELPPGTQPLAENFPVRNRIIAGISHGTLIIESEEEGGTAITASMAVSLGRDVFAAPGAPYLQMSALSNMLIAKGAYPVTSAKEILEYYGRLSYKKTGSAGIKQIQLDFLQRQIYNLLLQGDASVENMALCIEYPQSEINAALTMMELGGIIKRLPGGKYGV
jgi:DNA processing protein